MNVLISLKSRIICEALFELLNRDNHNDHYLVEDMSVPFDCSPDVVIVDHKSISPEILSSWPDAKIILLDTGLHQNEIITLMLMYKLHGVVSTDADSTLMKKALKLVNDGQIWIDNNNIKALLCKFGDISKSGKIDSISKKEQDILDQIMEGRKNKEIADRLCISEQTVKAHISHIFKKFHVHSRSQLISHHLKTSHENPDTP